MELKLEKVISQRDGQLLEELKFKLYLNKDKEELFNFSTQIPNQNLLSYLYSYYELDQSSPIAVVTADFSDSNYPVILTIANKYISQTVPMLKLTFSYYLAVVDFSSPLVSQFYDRGILLRYDFEVLEEKSITPMCTNVAKKVQFQ